MESGNTVSKTKIMLTIFKLAQWLDVASLVTSLNLPDCIIFAEHLHHWLLIGCPDFFNLNINGLNQSSMIVFWEMYLQNRTHQCKNCFFTRLKLCQSSDLKMRSMWIFMRYIWILFPSFRSGKIYITIFNQTYTDLNFL